MPADEHADGSAQHLSLFVSGKQPVQSGGSLVRRLLGKRTGDITTGHLV
jgi:hypothetical protein